MYIGCFVKESDAAAAVDTVKNDAHQLAAQQAAAKAALPRRCAGSSPYRGITWNKSAKMWVARTKIDGKRLYIGCFVKVSDAAAAVDTVKNDPHQLEALKAAAKAALPKKKTSSQYPGVSWNKNAKKWRAYGPKVGGKQKWLGRFEEEAGAARAAKQVISS